MWRVAAAAVVLYLLIAGLTNAWDGEGAVSKYITAPVERSVISRTVKATGTVEAVVTVDVSSQLSGRIADVFVNFNDAVSAGQPIAKLDQEIYAARVSEASAALIVAEASAEVQSASVERAKVAVVDARTAQRMAEAQSAATQARQVEAERELERKLVLAGKGITPERDLSLTRTLRETTTADLSASREQVHMKVEAIAMAEAELHMAEASLHNAKAVVQERRAALDQANLDLERTVMRAPINGVILKRDVNPGQTVAVTLEAKTLFKIANDLSKMEVHARIDEADVGKLKPGQTASFTVDAYPDRSFAGRILQIRKFPR